MKKLAIIAALMMSGCASINHKSFNECDYYAYAGLGYEIGERRTFYTVDKKGWAKKMHDDDTIGRFGAFTMCGDFRYSFDHRSDFINGWPFNNNTEMTTNEFAADYIYKF